MFGLRLVELELPLVDSLRSKNAFRSNQSYSASFDSQNDSGGRSGATSGACSVGVSSSSARVSQAILRSVPPQTETRVSRSTCGILGEKKSRERKGEF